MWRQHIVTSKWKLWIIFFAKFLIWILEWRNKMVLLRFVLIILPYSDKVCSTLSIPYLDIYLYSSRWGGRKVNFNVMWLYIILLNVSIILLNETIILLFACLTVHACTLFLYVSCSTSFSSSWKKILGLAFQLYSLRWQEGGDVTSYFKDFYHHFYHLSPFYGMN